MTRNPSSASADTCLRHRRPESAKPWSRTTGRPSSDLDLNTYTAVDVDAHLVPSPSTQRRGY